MKLAQALSQRADLKKRIDQLESRLIQNAKVQEGEAPAEEPAQLMKELQGALRQMEELISRINLTNAATRTADGTLTELLARRDCMMLEVGILRSFLQSASSTVSRGMRTEIRILSTVNVQQEQKKLDSLSAQLRELDETIQSLNWTTELL